jgi:hypothetical protein
VIDERFEEITD